MISSGSSGTVTMFFSRTNCVASASAARAASSTSSRCRALRVGELERGLDRALLLRGARACRACVGAAALVLRAPARAISYIAARVPRARSRRARGSPGATAARTARTRASGRRAPRRAGSRPWLRARAASRARSGAATIGAARLRHAGAAASSCSSAGSAGDLRARSRRRASTCRPAFCFAAVSAWIFGTRAGSSTSRTCARKRGSSSSRLPSVLQAFGQRREIARQQVVQAVAGDARVDQRIPAPVLAASGCASGRTRDRGAAAARRPGSRATASLRSMRLERR